MSIYFFPGIGICKLFLQREFPLGQNNFYSLSNLSLSNLEKISPRKTRSCSLILEDNVTLNVPVNNSSNLTKNSKIPIFFPFIYCYFVFYSSLAIFFIFHGFRSLIYGSKIKGLGKIYSLIALFIIILFLYFSRGVASLKDNCNSKVLCISMENTEDILVDYLVSLKVYNRFSKNENIRKITSFTDNDFELQLDSNQINSIVRVIWKEGDWRRIINKIKKNHVHSQCRNKFQNLRKYLQEITELDFIDQNNPFPRVYSNDFNFLTFFCYKFSKTLIFMIFISLLTSIFYFCFRKSLALSMKILLIVLNIIFLILFSIFLSYYKMLSQYQDSPDVFSKKLQNLSSIFTNIHNYKKNPVISPKDNRIES